MRPLLPRPPLYRAALLFRLAGLCLGAAIVITSRTGDLFTAGHQSADDITGSIAAPVHGGIRIGGSRSGGSVSAGSLPLSDEQRGHIFDGIMKLHDAPVAAVLASEAATAVPGSVALQELPASVTRDIPVVQGYKFVKLEDRILLVSPVDRSVVAQLPRYRTVLN